MSEKAVRAFLALWLKRQTKGKVRPLLFRKPQNDEEVSESEQADVGDRQVGVATTGAVERQDIPNEADDNRGSEEMGEERVEAKDDNGRENRAGVSGGGKESDGSQEQEGGDMDATASSESIPDTPRDVGTSKSQRLKYLQSLCDDPMYRSLLSLLKTAKVLYILVIVRKLY